MQAVNFHIRDLPKEAMLLLKKEAKKEKSSINSVIINLIEQGLGYRRVIKKRTYHELDHLAGTWDANDVKSFEKNTKAFEAVDTNLWE